MSEKLFTGLLKLQNVSKASKFGGNIGHVSRDGEKPANQEAAVIQKMWLKILEEKKSSNFHCPQRQ